MIVKYGKDTRYTSDELMSTHDKTMMVARPAEQLSAIADEAEHFDVIGIDEGQFFEGIVDFCEDMANAGKIIIVACLDGTFQRQAFGSVLGLVPLAEQVTKLTAICMLCYQPASFSKRLGTETAIEVIGGSDKYIAVCRNCFNEDHETPAKDADVADTQALLKKASLVDEPAPRSVHVGRDI